MAEMRPLFFMSALVVSSIYLEVATACSDSSYTGYTVHSAEAGCNDLKPYCRHSTHGEGIRQKCPETCNVCSCPKLDSSNTGYHISDGRPATCSNLAPWCEDAVHGAGIRAKCPHSCKACPASDALAKQKLWAAKAMVKLESKVCSRESKGRQLDKPQTSQAEGRRRRGAAWWEKGTCPNGWTNSAGTCWQSCKDMHPAGEWAPTHFGTCYHRCPLGWQDSARTCYHPCSEYGGFEETCGPLYCAVDSQACVEKSLEIGMAFAEMIGNAVGPAAKAYSANKKVLKAAVKGTWTQKRLAFKAFFRTFAKELRKKMAKKLTKRMRGVVSNDENEILQGGAELVIESYMAREIDDAALKALAMDVAAALDPTGVMNVVQSFQAPSCKSRAIDWMPAIGQRRLTGFSANGSFPLGVNGTKNDLSSFENGNVYEDVAAENINNDNDIEDDPISFEDGDVYEDPAVENTNVSLTAHLPIGDVFITSENDPINIEDGDVYEDAAVENTNVSLTAHLPIGDVFITSESGDMYEEEDPGSVAEATAKNEAGSQRRLRGLYVV